MTAVMTIVYAGITALFILKRPKAFICKPWLAGMS